MLEGFKSLWHNPKFISLESSSSKRFNLWIIAFVYGGREKFIFSKLEKLFLIVNNRYNNYLPIVITTNYNRNQLRERLCINKNYSIVDSIISRLYEMCGGIEIKDDDHRMSDSLIRESLWNGWDDWSIS